MPGRWALREACHTRSLQQMGQAALESGLPPSLLPCTQFAGLNSAITESFLFLISKPVFFFIKDLTLFSPSYFGSVPWFCIILVRELSCAPRAGLRNGAMGHPALHPTSVGGQHSPLTWVLTMLPSGPRRAGCPAAVPQWLLCLSRAQFSFSSGR